MHIGMRLLHPAAVDHSVSISRQQARHLLLWSQKHLRSLRAIHIPGLLNRTADELSRAALPGEWRLHPQTVQLIWRHFGLAQLDLFTSLETHTEGVTETSRRRTDDLGSRLEKPIHFECKLNEPMHIGMRLLQPAAADHSVSVSRRQVQCIFRFSLRSRAGARPLSGGTGAVVTGRLCSLLQGTRVTYVTETFPISRSLSMSRRRTDDLGSLPKGHCPFQFPVEASCAVIF